MARELMQARAKAFCANRDAWFVMVGYGPTKEAAEADARTRIESVRCPRTGTGFDPDAVIVEIPA